MDRRFVGPSFKEIANKYRGQNVQQYLINKVIAGGVGVWGQVPAPPMRQVPVEDLEIVVRWITEL